jgi:hypothetical protein
MNKAEFEKLKEASWRRKLTDEEQTALNGYLAAHFEERALWPEESGLNQMLAGLPDAPVSTNFTARVLQAVERDATSASRRSHGIFHWLKLNWVPRIAVMIVLVCGGFVSLQRYHRVQIAHDVAAVSSVATVPPQWLQDFDAINRLSQPPVDNELLAALQ